MEYLSYNFTLEELTSSYTATSRHIDNTPNEEQKKNLKILAEQILQPTRNEFGKPLHINSGFRCAALNKAVGGASKSYHLNGQAADIHASCSAEGYMIAALLLRRNLTDIVIFEKRGSKIWVHVQWSYAPRHKFITDIR